jgi:hypothetical protein
MRNANECRAKDPRTCYYHGAIIEMNTAMERITTAGTNAKPADWDGYFTARQKVETAEEDLKKQQWLEESQDIRAPKEPYKRNQFGKGGQGSQNGFKPGTAAGRGNGTPSRRPQSDRNTARSQPVVATKVAYNDAVFPPQIKWKDEMNKPAIFTRHDKTSQLPRGVMIATNRPLSNDEAMQLVAYVKYQHTISTRDGKEIKTISDKEIVYNHTPRSVYIRTQFEDAEQVQGFHSALSQMMSNGTAPRKDGTQKYEAFGDEKAEFALYYNN